MKTLFKILIGLFFGYTCQGQKTIVKDSSYLLVQKYIGDIADAAIDNLDNLYVISSTGQIKKYSANGDSTGLYNQTKHYGKLYSLDVSNPLRPLLFYKDFSTIVLLDRFLTNRTRLDLRVLSIFQPGAVGSSYDNNIWVFDEYDNKLKKIDEQGTLLFESSDFRTIFNGTIRPQKIMDANSFVYLMDSVNGVFVFDIYGSFKKKLPVTNWNSITVKENCLIQTQKNQIIIFNTNTYLATKKNIPVSIEPYTSSFSTLNKLITFSADSLHVYQYRF